MADINEDTQPMPVPFNAEELAEELLGVTDEETEQARERIPEPAMVRGGVTAAVGLLGLWLKAEIDARWIDYAMDAYIAVAPVVMAWFIRRRVSPT